MSDARQATVAELQAQGVLLVEDGNHGEYRPRPDEFADVGTAFIRAADMDSGRVTFNIASHINDRARQRITKGIGAPGDVLLSHKGTVGKVALVPMDAPPFVCSPQTTFWRTLRTDVLDRGYLYAYLRSRPFAEQLASRAGETDMAPYVSLTSQRGLRIPLPPIVTQRHLARILGALDDKIELNRRMSETIEATAQALFKSWFVDLDSDRAESRLDSRVGSLLDVADLLSGGTPRTDQAEYWGGDIRWASAKDISQCNGPFLVETERHITSRGLAESPTQMIPAMSSVVVARGATTGRLAMLGESMAMNQTCYALTSRGSTPFWLYLQLRQVMGHLVHSAHGSVFDTITTRTFASAMLPLPPESRRREFDKLVAPLLRQVLRSSREIRTLSEIRDGLLPRLLSGQLSITTERPRTGGLR